MTYILGRVKEWIKRTDKNLLITTDVEFAIQRESETSFQAWVLVWLNIFWRCLIDRSWKSLVNNVRELLHWEKSTNQHSTIENRRVNLSAIRVAAVATSEKLKNGNCSPAKHPINRPIDQPTVLKTDLDVVYDFVGQRTRRERCRIEQGESFRPSIPRSISQSVRPSITSP